MEQSRRSTWFSKNKIFSWCLGGAKQGWGNAGGLGGGDDKTALTKGVGDAALKGRNQSVGQFRDLNKYTSEAKKLVVNMIRQRKKFKLKKLKI